MKISILSHNISSNCLGRAYLLAEILSQQHEVEILGPKLGESVWEPLRHSSKITIKEIPYTINPFKIVKHVDGDIIYAIKPKMTSYGYALYKKFLHKTPVILDIDDWEIGFYLDSRKKDLILDALSFWDINNLSTTYIMQKLIFLADKRTVSCNFLKNKFNGTLIRHARDSVVFNPNNYDVIDIKNKLNINNKKVVLFLGTLRKHKGLEQIAKAVSQSKKMNALLLVIGAEEKDKDIIDNLKSILNQEHLVILGPQPFSSIPKYLKVADIVILPQIMSNSTIGQMPAKLFDAMAMGKAIISTDVSDIGEVLKGCGLIVNPLDKDGISKALKKALQNELLLAKLGTEARRKFLKHYSYDAVKYKLFNVFNSQGELYAK